MPLNFSFFFQSDSLPEDIFIFCVGLRKIVEAESLGKLQFAAAFRIALDQLIDAPLDFGGRTFPAAAEILVVFDLELTDVPFELAQLFVDGRHAWRSPSGLHARSPAERSQPGWYRAMLILNRAGAT